MLDTFVQQHRQEIILRCRTKTARRSGAEPPADLEDGIPRFLDQLVGALRNDHTPVSDICTSAARHGRSLHLQGVTVSQVVHDYGDVCQSVTDLAVQLNEPISVEEFRTLNRCLDDAIASAVTEYGRGHQSAVDAEFARDNERLGFLSHEIRNLVGTACVAFEVLKTGNVGVGGSTGGVLDRSLSALRDLINRSLLEVHLRHDVRKRTQFALADLIADLAPAARLDAAARGLSFQIEGGDTQARVDADRSVLSAVFANLLNNAFKFTRPGSMVTLRGRATTDRVLLEVEDECGGLPEGRIDDLFTPFEQQGADRSGVGLGLAMCRWGADVSGGSISARSLTGHGCVFTVDLPRLSSS